MIKRVLGVFWRRLRNGSILDPWVCASTLIIYALEQRRPAGAKSVDSPAVVNDIGWLLLQNAGSAVGSSLLQTRMLSPVAPIAKRSPVHALVGGAVSIAAYDFYQYASHVGRHKIPILWRFHSTHHSAERLNHFTADRLHPVDNFLAVMFSMTATRVLGTGGQISGPVRTLIGCLGRTHHANLDWHWPGVSRVLVSPAAHRIHHSVEPDHYDVNYGVTFSLWDRMFGTYIDPEGAGAPDTGLPGYGIPHPETMREVPASLVGQVAAPFRSSRPGLPEVEAETALDLRQKPSAQASAAALVSLAGASFVLGFRLTRSLSD